MCSRRHKKRGLSDEPRPTGRSISLASEADCVGPDSALDAGVPGFIDLLASHNVQLADIYTGGIAHARAVNKTTFLEAGPQRRYSKHWSRHGRSSNGGARMDRATKIQNTNIGYLGNSAMIKYVVPEPAINYALKRSPFA